MLKLCVFAVVVAVAAAKGGFQIPKACADAKDEAKQCFKDALAETGINFEMKDVHECLKQCPPREGKRDGQGNGEGKGRHGKDGDHRASFKEMHECMKEEIGDEIEKCIDDKVDFELIEYEGRGHGLDGKHHRGGKRHHGGKGRGGRKRGFFHRASCSEEVEQCVRGVVGEWFDKQDELKQALCDAGEKCWTGPSEECKTQKQELKDAMCACQDEHETEVKAALDKCAADLPKFARRRLGNRMDKFCKDSSSGDDESSDKSHKRESHHRLCDDSASAEDDEDDDAE